MAALSIQICDCPMFIRLLKVGSSGIAGMGVGSDEGMLRGQVLSVGKVSAGVG
jgi:hypothetical protein